MKLKYTITYRDGRVVEYINDYDVQANNEAGHNAANGMVGIVHGMRYSDVLSATVEVLETKHTTVK